MQTYFIIINTCTIICSVALFENKNVYLKEKDKIKDHSQYIASFTKEIALSLLLATMRNRKETPPLKETYMDEIRKFGPKRNLHRILRFRKNGSKRNLHTFEENGAKRREKNKIFRHKK